MASSASTAASEAAVTAYVNQHPQKLIADKIISDDEIKNAYDSFLQQLPLSPPCNSDPTSCGCVQDLNDAQVRDSVTTYLVMHYNKPKRDRDQTLLDWLRAARACSAAHNNSQLYVPFPLGKALPPDTAQKLCRRSRLCQAGLQSIFGIDQEEWRTIYQMSERTGMVPSPPPPAPQFAKACQKLQGRQGVQVIEISYNAHDDDESSSPRLMAKTTKKFRAAGAWHEDIQDEAMDIDGWRQYGRSIQRSNRIKELWLQLDGRHVDSVSSEARRCLRAFFHEMKDNKSILAFLFDPNMITAVSDSDLRYFLQNNHNLAEVDFWGNRPISLEQATYISNALRDIPIKKLSSRCNNFFTNNGAFEPILSACRNVTKLCLRLQENYQCTALAAFLRDPSTLLQELYLERVNQLPDFDVERAERELVAGLLHNSKLKIFKVDGLFGGGGAMECFKNLLCDTSSLDSVIQSNHTLQNIQIINLDYEEAMEWEEKCQPYYNLNKNPNKDTVIRCKIMQFYLSGDNFNPSSLANMPLGVLAQILGMNVPKKQSAMFNILKSVSELCAVSSRGGVPNNKRQKISM